MKTHPDSPNGCLLVPSIRAGATDIFAVDPVSGDAKNLTRHPSENRYPAWSPDGTRFAFTSDRDGAHNLYLLGADGTGLRQLTWEVKPAICFLPTWSADGGIAFGRDTGERVEMVVMRADGSPPTVVGHGADPCISPDGRRVSYAGKVGQGYGVFVMDVDGRNPRPLTTHENRIGAVMPTWSPDSRRLLYSDQVGEALEIFICEGDGGKPGQLTRLGKICTSPAWTPDGQWISFRVTDRPFWRDPTAYAEAQKQRDTLRPVWVMRADGSDPHPIETLRCQCATDGSRAVWRPGGDVRIEGAKTRL